MEAKPVKSRNVCVVFTSCFHLCLSAHFVFQEVLCKYSRWGVGGEQALRLWTAESERDVRHSHSRLFKKKRKKMWICRRSVPSRPRRSQTCDRANTVLLVFSFTASAITTKKSKVFCTYTFWPLLHRKADSFFFFFFWLAWTCGTRRSVLRGEPGASSAVKVHF